MFILPLGYFRVFEQSDKPTIHMTNRKYHLTLQPAAVTTAFMIQPPQSGAAVKNRPTVTTKVVMGQLAIGSAVEIKPSSIQALMVLNHWLRKQQENRAYT